MEQSTHATAATDDAGSRNPHPWAPSGVPSPIDNLTGSVSDGQPAKACGWMKLRPRETPKEELKSSKLSKKMKHLSPLFESQLTE